MTGDLAELGRQAVRAEVEPLRRALERLAGHALTPQQRATVEALAAVFGSAAFTTGEVVRACALPIGARPALRDALLSHVGSLAPQRVGIALGRLVELGGEAGALQLTAPRNERGRRLWCIDRRTGWG